MTRGNCLLVVIALLAAACSNAAPDPEAPLPQCADFLNNRGGVLGPYFSGPIATVETRGAIDYHNVDLTMPAEPIDVVATLTSVDPIASSFVLTTDEGRTEVYVTQVPTDWLAALPVGESVAGHFENGVTLSDMSDDELILAVIAQNNVASDIATFDSGAVHLEAGRSTCIWTWWPNADGPTGCVVGVTDTDLNAMGTSFARFRPGQFTIDALSFSAMLVQSTRQAGIDEAVAAQPTARSACLPAFTTTFSVVVRRDPA